MDSWTVQVYLKCVPCLIDKRRSHIYAVKPLENINKLEYTFFIITSIISNPIIDLPYFDLDFNKDERRSLLYINSSVQIVSQTPKTSFMLLKSLSSNNAFNHAY